MELAQLSTKYDDHAKHALKGTFWLETMHYATFWSIMNSFIKDIQDKHKHQVSHNITFKQYQHENLYLGPSPQETLMLYLVQCMDGVPYHHPY